MKRFLPALLSILLITFQDEAFSQMVYAGKVLDYSREYDEYPWAWNHIAILGAPDVYPEYGDLGGAWIPESYTDQRDWIELEFDNSNPIDSIFIWETYNPGFVDTVYVKNPGTGQWEMVYSTTAGPAPLVSRILKIGFPTTSFNVSQVRIAVRTILATDYVEIDAVAISPATHSINLTPDPGFCMGFNGVSDRFKPNQMATNLVTTTEKTVSAWVKVMGDGPFVFDVYNGAGIIADAEGYFGLYQCELPTSGGTDSLWFYNYDINGTTKIGTDFTMGQWMHLAMVHESGQMKLYKDAMLVGSGTSDTSDYLWSTLEFGFNWYDSIFWKGDLDEVVFFDKALSQQEIKDVMDLKLTGNETGLTGYWRFNEGSGTEHWNPVNHVKDEVIGGTWTTSDIPNPVGIADPKPIESIEIYPNPGQGQFIISASGLSSADMIEITDIAGKRILAIDEVKRNNVTIDLSNEVPGLYLVNIYFENTILTGKLMLEK